VVILHNLCTKGLHSNRSPLGNGTEGEESLSALQELANALQQVGLDLVRHRVCAKTNEEI
jgi:hypothetical protein